MAISVIEKRLLRVALDDLPFGVVCTIGAVTGEATGSATGSIGGAKGTGGEGMQRPVVMLQPKSQT